MRIPYQELYEGLLRVLLKAGFETERARVCAGLFTDASRDGVYSHGLNRFPRFMEMIRRIGNNPLVIAVPHSDGHIVLDMAMSQFSYGTLESYRMRSEQLPVFGGFDLQGELTRDASAIEASARPLPIGYWKGSGLALMLDLLAALLSGGNATHQIAADSFQETGLSQVFLAFDLPLVDKEEEREQLMNQIIEYVQSANPSTGERVRYPGERTLEIRKENLEKGIPVEPQVWQQVQGM
jgi:3-dehydro-L-gulonate 2-dehydrogenase